MVRQPKPQIIARNLRQVADQLDDTGTQAIRIASLLAARGWPASTTGTDGGRNSDCTSSTERAALKPGPYDDIDGRLARQLRLLWATSVQLQETFITVLSQASTDDALPLGTGTCLRCDKFVRPDAKRPHNRIQAGYCPACYRKWWRLGKPDRSTFIRTSDEETAA
jgi:hypothetical protein